MILAQSNMGNWGIEPFADSRNASAALGNHILVSASKQSNADVHKIVILYIDCNFRGLSRLTKRSSSNACFR